MTKIQRVFERHENGVEEQFYPITHINAVNGLKDYFDANNGVFGVTSVNGQTGVVNINVLTDEEKRTLEQLQNGEINLGGNINNPNTENSLSSKTFINVVDFGAKNNQDSTVAINKAIEYAYDNSIPIVVIPNGVFLIKAHVDHDDYQWYLQGEGGIQMKDGITLLMSSQTILKALPNGERAYNIIQCHQTKSAKIIGGTLIGTVGRHNSNNLDKLGECGYGVSCIGASDIYIENVTSKLCWGDGFNFQGKEVDGKWQTNNNIIMENCHAYQNRRQGISIELIDGFLAIDCSFNNTGEVQATEPMCGLDIEPWDLEYKIPEVKAINIHFVRCQFNNNLRNGAIVMGKTTKHVKFTECEFKDNKKMEVMINFGVEDIIIQNNRFYNSGTLKAGLVVDGSTDIKISDNSFQDCFPVFTVTNGDFKGYVSVKDNDILFKEETDITEALLLNVPKTDTPIMFSGNRVEVLSVIKSSNAIDVIVDGNNAIYRDNEFINLRVGFNIKGNRNLIERNNIHSTLFDAITVSGEDNKLNANIISGSGGYFSIKVMPNVSSIDVLNNTIIEKDLMVVPNGTNLEKYKNHNNLPSISLGVKSPEEQEPALTIYPNNYNIRVVGNKHVGANGVSVALVQANENILSKNKGVHIHEQVRLIKGKELPNEAQIGDIFLDIKNKKLYVCVKSVYFGEDDNMIDKAEWLDIMGSESPNQIQDTGWKDIKLEVGYTFDEYTKPQYRILNGYVALKGEIKGITKEQVNKKIATLDYAASPDKIMFVSCLVQNDDIKFAKLQIDGDGNINLLTTQESGNIVLNNVYPTRIEE